MRLEITANIVGPKKPHTSAERFRDMHALAQILQPTLGHPPSSTQFLQASQKGDKKKIEIVFANSLTICATVKWDLDKNRTVLASPVRFLPRKDHSAR